MMLLTIDIGNTNIKLALFKKDKVRASLRLATDKQGSLIQYQRLIKGFFAQKRISNSEIGSCIICSVVPKLTRIFKRLLYLLFERKPFILGEDIIAPIKNLYKRPKQVGQDRLANAVAACSKFEPPIIIVDFGTAVTFDLISAKGNYLGGVIFPGMEVSLQTLIEKTSLLPKTSLHRPIPKTLLGRDTATSIKSGIIYGYSFLVEGILHALKKKFNKRARVIATGGKAVLMAQFCSSICQVEENLTLSGLNIIYKTAKISNNA